MNYSQTQIEFPTPEKKYMQSEGFGAVEARYVRIMSVHFERKEIQFFHSRRKKFVLEAASADKPTFVDVYDSAQAIQDTTHLMTKEGGAGEASMLFIAMPVPVDIIVRDCLDNWCYSGIGDSAKYPAGIIALAGESPTPEEYKRAVEQESILCGKLVEEADTIFVTKNGRIEDRHRKALLWLGSERKPWFEKTQLGMTKRGAASGQRIPMEALVDAGQDLMEFYIKHNLRPADFEDAYVANMFASKPSLVKTLRERVGIKTRDDSN